MGDMVGNIYSTTDYSVFKKLNGNRGILESRKALIVHSISERGWIRNPIVVNEYMEVIDGQGRLEALRELGLPVEYVVSKGATIADCIALNIKQTNWKSVDYVKCYADMGYVDYIVLLSQYGTFHHLPDMCINALACKSACEGSKSSSLLKNGLLKIHDKENFLDRCMFADKCIEIIGRGNGRLRNWCAVIKFVYYCDKISNDLFLERLVRNHNLITPCVTLKQILECIEEVYNYGVKRSNKVYFIPEWDLFMRYMKGAN
jgi:hypothetical protein